MTIKELIEILKTVPQEATWRAGECEVCGIRIDDPRTKTGWGWGFVHDGKGPFPHLNAPTESGAGLTIWDTVMP